MNFTITTKSNLKKLLAKNGSDFTVAFDAINQMDADKHDSRIIMMPSEEWKEIGNATRCSDAVFRREQGDIHMMYVSTCHMKNVQMMDYRLKPSEKVVLDIVPVIGRDEGVMDTIYVVFALPNKTGKLNHKLLPNDIIYLTSIYGSDADTIIEMVRESYFAHLNCIS